VNVEAQLRSPSSLLHWTRRLIATRRKYKAFGRGTLSFLEPGNRKVLAFLREFEDEAMLCVANLSRVPQAVELDLARFQGRVPWSWWDRSRSRRWASSRISSRCPAMATWRFASPPTRNRRAGTRSGSRRGACRCW
jgi:hypothetical protein